MCERLARGRLKVEWLATEPVTSKPQVQGPLSLAIPPWVGAMSTGYGFCH